MGVDGPVDRYYFTDHHLGIDTFGLPNGFAAYEDNLNAAFPDQRTQIQSLMAMLYCSTRHLDRLDFLYSDQPSHFWIEQTEALGAIFDQIGCSPGLRAVFGMPSVLIGVPPALCPQFFHTMALASYLFSAWRLENHGAHMTDVCVIDRNLLSVKKDINKLNGCSNRDLPQHVGAGLGLNKRG